MNREHASYVIPEGIPCSLALRLERLEWATMKLNHLSRFPNGNLKDQCIRDIHEIIDEIPTKRDELHNRMQIAESTVLTLRKEVKDLTNQLNCAQSSTDSDVESLEGHRTKHNAWLYIMIAIASFVLGRLTL